ncbi:MAG: BatA domain-containing protein, partial [Phycisphaerae bacterium]|nr:BatA domain-containing protein [Phycisphaerae bacterium]
MIALTFGAPLLLIGLAAAGIPPLLHLISSVRAREQYFPTLRFLRLTMEKTARRRRLRNWLLLLLRSLALAVLAMAVAQPISEATGGWLGGSGQAAVVVLDDTYSMTATPEPGGESLFARARADASALLSGENKPRLAALTSASLTAGPAQLTGQLDLLRQDLAGAAVNFGPPSLTESIVAAVEALDAADSPDRSLYLLTDGQAVGLDAD